MAWTCRVEPETVDDPQVNLDAAATLLSGIESRTYRSTAAKIADLYHGLGLDRTTDYGATVEDLMERKPWIRRQLPPHRY
jgi:hypothetical protein